MESLLSQTAHTVWGIKGSPKKRVEPRPAPLPGTPKTASTQCPCWAQKSAQPGFSLLIPSPHLLSYKVAGRAHPPSMRSPRRDPKPCNHTCHPPPFSWRPSLTHPELSEPIGSAPVGGEAPALGGFGAELEASTSSLPPPHASLSKTWFQSFPGDRLGIPLIPPPPHPPSPTVSRGERAWSLQVPWRSSGTH